ncbi:UDP-N-acetylmuramoyl-tripeptide--D-alanyl-D-alanine ligase [Buchnera aphidicola (Muscaphis stroyani)]|uniref:UDP-N-acetylmuramoyl-tripeptide--D-alanyl-D-alanine ligase n=1 Tax=Buchnera aphidicola (Muscaphis stroyani) TaxID=1241869 RepID=A0A4D6Y4M6_9GAMM|nr:UDP-N-acetylmuramoyl-tripeptide--D-alanyl-D-alanine ligase [Buchnera aphidicola]QCI24307.1 UDP-N-acetylmuramoyl-tripeptide--D-alanyl-D-alanine ligase [Buchnera aphidicola (Muscaphis stroyani)]
MIPISLKKIAEVTDGKLYGKNIIIHEIATNTNEFIPGCLFVALIGKKFNAHTFIKDAIKKNCSAILTQEKIKFHISHVLVKNTSIALGKIACWIRHMAHAKILAITGSSGKTSVKEMTSSILKRNGNTICTIKNENNHIGAPLTLLQLTYEHKYAVVELGANHPGEIHYTANIVQPDIVLINNINYAHLEGFKSLWGVSKAKSEIFSGLKEKGTAIVNLDSHHLSQWKKKIKDRNSIYFSTQRKKLSHFFASDIKTNVTYTSFTMHSPYGKIKIKLPFLGYQSVSNALAASACAFSLKIPLHIIQKGLLESPMIPGRLETTFLNPNKILINDTYNSNIASMIASIKVLEKMPGYKILVTGDMAELGKNSIVYHQVIGNTANISKINKIFSIGSISNNITQIFNNSRHFYHQSQLAKTLKKMILKKKKITILIKGSRSSKMEKVVNHLIKENK